MARDQIEYCGDCPLYANCKACWGKGQCKAGHAKNASSKKKGS